MIPINKGNQYLILIRGIPGSGKSTLAKKLIADLPDMKIINFEADQYFYQNGVYVFDKNKLSLAHEQCKSNTAKALQEGKTVIVSNTFTRLWEMEWYIAEAKKLNIQLLVIRTTGHYENIHGVPESTMNKFKSQFQDFENEILIK